VGLYDAAHGRIVARWLVAFDAGQFDSIWSA
jgi:hypothetical protein